MTKSKTFLVALAIMAGLLVIVPSAYAAEASNVSVSTALTAAEGCVTGCASICKCPETGDCNCEVCKCEDCSCANCSPGAAIGAQACGCSDCGCEQGTCVGNGCGDAKGKTCEGLACKTECSGSASCH